MLEIYWMRWGGGGGGGGVGRGEGVHLYLYVKASIYKWICKVVCLYYTA